MDLILMASDLLIIVLYHITNELFKMKTHKELFEIPPLSAPEIEPGHVPDFPEIPGNHPEEIPDEEPGKNS